MPSHHSPTDERLRRTIAQRMRSRPIDQPLMLLELHGHGSAANSQPGLGAGHRQADPGKRMVGRVLNGNRITCYGDGLYSLIGEEELSDSEQDALLRWCACWSGWSPGDARRWSSSPGRSWSGRS